MHVAGVRGTAGEYRGPSTRKERGLRDDSVVEDRASSRMQRKTCQ